MFSLSGRGFVLNSRPILAFITAFNEIFMNTKADIKCKYSGLGGVSFSAEFRLIRCWRKGFSDAAYIVKDD
jgi:hypothetical protein